MPVTTRPSPSQVGRNEDRIVERTADGSIDPRSAFNAITEDCHSPYENDPRRPGYQAAKGPRNRMLMGPSRNHFEGMPMIASSFRGASTSRGDAEASSDATIATYENGFVRGLIRAFNQDLHLVIRPDDVWQAILSQFSLFVNGNAERLRHLFVAHEGKRDLVVNFMPTDLHNIDFGVVAQEFVSAVQANVVDEELKEWLLPSFSTTTDHDVSVAAFGIMGALQQYFNYHVFIGCGLPSVTLLGERADWASLAARIERLPRYGSECARWAQLLQPVLRHFLLTFDAPESSEVHDFWMRVAHEAGSEGSGNGLRTLSGWITAFAYFGEKGDVIKDFTDEEARKIDERTTQRFHASVAPERKRLVLDGVQFPLMRPASIPRSIIILPLVIHDMRAGIDRFTTVISGSVGMSMSAGGTTAQPVSAWWIVQEFEKPIDPPDQVEMGNSARDIDSGLNDLLLRGQI